jgi:hypothetical protein
LCKRQNVFDNNFEGRCPSKRRAAQLYKVVNNKKTGAPLYFRYLPGNIVDVSTLETTVKELVLMSVGVKVSLIDAGYYSEDKIRFLYKQKIGFLLRLPAGRVLFSELLEQNADFLEVPSNAVVFGERVLYIRKVPVELFGEFGAFAFVCCDIARRAEETVRCLKVTKDDGLSDVDVSLRLCRTSVFVLLSSLDVSVGDVLGLYYLRESMEGLFRVDKCYADFLPLRVHSLEALRSVLFLNFLSVMLYFGLVGVLPVGVSVESSLKQMRNLVCKVFDGSVVLPLEANKMQKTIMASIENTVGKF